MIRSRSASVHCWTCPFMSVCLPVLKTAMFIVVSLLNCIDGYDSNAFRSSDALASEIEYTDIPIFF
jgi:hypothetical protein